MNKLPLLAASLLAAAPALAAGPKLVAEPGVAEVKLELARPAVALPGVSAAAPAASLEAAPAISAAADAAAASPAAPAAEAAAAPSQDAAADRAAQDAKFDGSAAYGAADDSALPEVDFGQAVSPRHRDLLREALAAHADELEGFFYVTGRPHPGFLYVSSAHDDSPGFATVVTRVVYAMSGHSSRFDERVADRFWLGLDLKTKKIEFFTKEPLSVMTKRLSEHYLPLIGKNKVIGVGLSADRVVVLVEKAEDRAGVKAEIEASFPDIAPHVDYVVTGRIVAHSAPAAVSPDIVGAVKLRFASLNGRGLVDAMAWKDEAPALGEHSVVPLNERAPGSGDEYAYSALIPAGQGDLVFYVRRSGGLAPRTVYAGPVAISQRGLQARLQAVLAEEDKALAGRIVTGIALQVLVRASTPEDLATAKAIVARRLPGFESLFKFEVVTGRIVAQGDAASAQTSAKTPGLAKPDWFGAPSFKQAGFFGAGGAYATYLDENGALMRIDSPRPGGPVTLRFAKKDGSSHVARVVDGGEAFALSSLLGQVQGRIALADSTRDAVIALREQLRRVFTGAGK